MQKHAYYTHIIFVLSLLLYGVLGFLNRTQGHTAIFAFFPVVAAAACWGWKGGLIAGVLAFPINILGLTLLGISPSAVYSPFGIVGHIFFVFQGLLIGFVVDMYTLRRNAELRLTEQILQNTADLKRAQAAEQQLATVLEQSADGIYITENKNRTIIMANQAFLKMVGMTRAELIGQEPYVFVPEVDKTYRTTLGEEITIDMQYYEKNFSILQDLLTKNMIRDWAYYIVSPDDELIPVEANVTNLLNSEGQRIGAISVVRDVTNHKLNEFALKRTNEFLNSILENSIDCIIISDETGHITFMNQAGLELLGYTLEEIIGKAVMELFSIQAGHYETAAGDSIWLSTEDIEAVYNRIAELLNTGKVSNYASYLMHKNGRLIEVEHSITLLHDQQNTRTGSVSITRDRSMRCRMERELSRQAELLSQANKELESFAYSVSHDLRAPLRSISGFSAALEEDFKDELPVEAHDFLQRIQKASQRMSLLIDDLLNLSRVSRYDMQRENTDLSAIAAKIIAQLREQTPERNVACTIQPGITAAGDPHLLRILLENLLGNAWKYTAKQTAPEIFFGFSNDGDRPTDHKENAAIFCVRDNGVGFDMTYADKLFSPFQRLHAEKDFPGTGIGLATVQRIVHRHGGKIWAHSTPETGTNFYFTL